MPLVCLDPARGAGARTDLPKNLQHLGMWEGKGHGRGAAQGGSTKKKSRVLGETEALEQLRDGVQT